MSALHAAVIAISLAGCGSSPKGTVTNKVATQDPGLTLAIVVNAQEIWIGNDEIEPPESPARHVGALKLLEPAIDKLGLAHRGGGDTGLIVTYSTAAKIRVPLGPITALTGGALGVQKDYYGAMGTDLVLGVELALGELRKSPSKRKVIIVIGDGNDTNNDAAKAELARQKTVAAEQGVAVYALIYKGELSDPGNVVSMLTKDTETVNSSEGFAIALGSTFDRCCR